MSWKGFLAPSRTLQARQPQTCTLLAWMHSTAVTKLAAFELYMNTGMAPLTLRAKRTREEAGEKQGMACIHTLNLILTRLDGLLPAPGRGARGDERREVDRVGRDGGVVSAHGRKHFQRGLPRARLGARVQQRRERSRLRLERRGRDRARHLARACPHAGVCSGLPQSAGQGMHCMCAGSAAIFACALNRAPPSARHTIHACAHQC